MGKYLRYIYLLAFIIVAYILLPVMNADYIYTIQDNNVFISGRTFMMDMLSRDGGWLMWVSSYFTQFFYYPWLGSTLLILFWVVIYWVTLQVFNIKEKLTPLALILPVFLLFHLLDYGYWIYYTKTPGFPFQLTIITLLSLLSTWVLTPVVKRIRSCPWQQDVIVISINLFLVLTGFGLSQCPATVSKYHHHFGSIKTTLTDKNFRHELRMYRALEDFRFDDVLKEMPKGNEESPTNLMVLYKNIALMHTGQIDKMFETNNCGIRPDTGDSLKIRTSQLGGSLIYYLFGQMNYSYRWAMENAVQYGLSFRNLKMMTRTAIFNHEFEVAGKYIALLKNSTFHRDWAFEHEAWMLNSTRFIQSKDFQTLSPLLDDSKNVLDGDDGLCQQFLMEYFSDLDHATTPLLEDVAMCMSLWAKDYYAFCIHFYDYAQNHPNKAAPTLYQEGAILLGTTEESPITLDNYRFDDLVADKFNNFVSDYNQLQHQGVDEHEMGNRLRSRYGNTYWWYYYFYNDFNIY